MRHSLLLLAAGGLLVACSDGVVVDPGPPPGDGVVAPERTDAASEPVVSADGAVTDVAAAAAINDPLNTRDEPSARRWSAANRSRTVACADGPAQGAADAFATDAFERLEDEDGPYLQGTRDTGDAPQYIEFCVTAPELAGYQIDTVVRADDPLGDSFFVTVDEDEPGTVAEPGIYDISRSPFFKRDVVRIRTENPLIVPLARGTHLLRFYLREPGAALRGIELQRNDSGGPVVDPTDPDGSDLARCAANTGLTVAEVDALIERYLGDAERRFVLRPFDLERGPGAPRDDYRWETAEGRGNVMCLATPPAGGSNLVDNTVSAERLVIGSPGTDVQRPATPLRGTFVGNGGDDRVGTLDGGLFLAGAGDDRADLVRGGVMDGGEGEDAVSVLRGGEFLGGPGDDAVTSQFDGVFDGGGGTDTLTRGAAGVRTPNVEDVGLVFEPLPSPSDLTFADATETTVVVGWRASPDERVQGYLVLLDDERAGSIVLDLGGDPRAVSPDRTRGTDIVKRVEGAGESSIEVYAYAELDDASFLYSEPLTGTFVPPGPEAALANVLATLEIDDTLLEEGTLTASGATVLSRRRASVVDGTPLFVRYDDTLRNAVTVFDDTVTGTVYRVATGDTRQYVLISRRTVDGVAPPELLAFGPDAENVLWRQEVPPLEGGSASGSFNCDTPSVTQDDWLACVRRDGSVLAFDPDGTTYSRPGGSLTAFGGLLLDGDAGVLVQVPNQEPSNAPTLTTLDVVGGQRRTVTLSSAGIPDGVELTVDGLAVDGDGAVLTGGFALGCVGRPGCGDGTDAGAGSGFYVLRAALSDGTVGAYVSGPLSARAVGDGGALSFDSTVGEVVGDTVFFARVEGFSRYRTDTLELVSRRTVPGRVLDAGASAVLSEVPVTDPDSGLVEGYRFFLSRP